MAYLSVLLTLMLFLCGRDRHTSSGNDRWQSSLHHRMYFCFISITDDICTNLVPSNLTGDPQQGESPFSLQVDSTTYGPNQQITGKYLWNIG